MMKTESISAQNRESLRQLRRRLVREQRAVSIRKFFRNKLSVVGMVLVLLMLICAVFAPLITGLLGVDPYTATMQERFQAPSAAHLFGTDNLGRDIFARVLYGAQISMTVGFTVGLLSALIGTALGLYACAVRFEDETPEGFLYSLRKTKAFIASARPTAQNLFWALERTERAAGTGTIPEMLARIRSEALAIFEEDIAICRLTGADVVRHALVQKIIAAYEQDDKQKEKRAAAAAKKPAARKTTVRKKA